MPYMTSPPSIPSPPPIKMFLFWYKIGKLSSQYEMAIYLENVRPLSLACTRRRRPPGGVRPRNGQAMGELASSMILGMAY